MTQEPDPVCRAATAVRAEHYRPHDGPIRQKTDSDVIHRHLRLLAVEPGMNVLEIGTGSGLSAALLAELVGPDGGVVSLDIESDLIDRARHLHAEAGRTNIISLAMDGLCGYPEEALYDRVIAWMTPPVLVRAWIHQTRLGGVIVQPVRIADLVHATVVARCVAGPAGVPEQVTLHRGAYVPMGSSGRLGREISIADAISRRDDVESYVSAAWLRHAPRAADVVLTKVLAARQVAAATSLHWPDTEHLKIWLIARDPGNGLWITFRGAVTLGEVGSVE